MINNRLFIYGSLLSNDNEFGQYIKNNAVFKANGIFTGRLFDCGEYPGAIFDKNGYPITGSIYSFNHIGKALTVLDDYEGFGPEQEQPNLFIRKLATVTALNQAIECHVYLYNLPVSGLTEIISGDYMAYLKS